MSLERTPLAELIKGLNQRRKPSPQLIAFQDAHARIRVRVTQATIVLNRERYRGIARQARSVATRA